MPMIKNPNYIPPKVEGLIPITAPTTLSLFGRDEAKPNSKEEMKND